jgi:hypothetical protein
LSPSRPHVLPGFKICLCFIPAGIKQIRIRSRIARVSSKQDPGFFYFFPLCIILSQRAGKNNDFPRGGEIRWKKNGIPVDFQAKKGIMKLMKMKLSFII